MTETTNLQPQYHDSGRQMLLCGGLSQEILQAAGAIEIASEFLEKNTRSMFPRSQQNTAKLCFEALDDSVMQLTRVADNLAELMKSDRKMMEAKMQPVDLHWQFDRIVRRVQLNKHVMDAKIVARFQENAFVFVSADPVFADKIFLNLLSNALQSGAESLVVRVGLEKKGENLLLTIADNGLGIEPAVMQHLFEPFCAEYATAERQNGTGLGLYLANEYCKSMGWTLKLQTGAEGTTALVEIPLKCDLADDALHGLARDITFCSAQDRRIQTEMSIL